jgi:RNA-directed DNA polymerase
VLLYLERWLKAPAMLEDGTLVPRERGTPQGGVISPLLANLFLHYAFDVWLGRAFPGMPFERYADDIICHCRSEREALMLLQALDRRFAECALVLHPEKTRVVYCKDITRTGDAATIQFDFLGYCFRPRLAKWPGGLFGVSYLPAASPKALKAIRQAIRRWSLQTRSDKALDDLARMFNPYIRGWINYYSHFYKSALYPTLRRIDAFIVRWARRKFKRLRQRPRGARNWLARVIRSSPGLFAHWPLLHGQGRTLGAV